MLTICTGNLNGSGLSCPALMQPPRGDGHKPMECRVRKKGGGAKTIMYKKLTRSGGLTIPRALRSEAGMLPGTPVVVERDETGIHIRKHVAVCFHCGTVEQVAEVYGIEICKDCAVKLMGVFANG